MSDGNGSMPILDPTGGTRVLDGGERIREAELRGFMRAVELLRDPELQRSGEFVGLDLIAGWLEERKP